MIRINLLPRPGLPIRREQPSTIGLSRRSVEHWVTSLGGLHDPRLFALEIKPAGSHLTGLKLELIGNLRAENRFSEEDLTLLEKAFDLMVGFHKDGSLPHGEKVVIHLLGVAKTLLSSGGDARLAAAAFLSLMPIADLQKAGIDADVLAAIQAKNTARSFLFVPLDENTVNEREAKYVAKMCLMHQSDPKIWLLEAADCFVTLTASDLIDKIVASRAYHVLPIILRWFESEDLALNLENIALMRLDPKEHARIEGLITDANKMGRKKALDHLKLLTELLSLDIEDWIGHRVEVDVKSVASALKKLRRGEALTDPARFRYIIKEESETDEAAKTRNRHLCKDVAEWIIVNMSEFGYLLDAEEMIKNYLGYVEFGDKNIDLGPKANGYESIHLHFVGPEGERIMVQVRTEAMHEHAEIGPSSHGRAFKLEGFVDGLSVGGANETRSALIAEGRRYGRFNGKIYRIVPFQPGKVPILLDLAFAAGPNYGLHCPEFVEVERIDPDTGQIVKLKLSAFSPLQNGDRISFDPVKTQLCSSTRLNKVASLYAMTVISLAQDGNLDETTGEERTSEAAERGKLLLGAVLSDEEAALRSRLANILKKDGQSGLPINLLCSLERVAKAKGLANEDALRLAIAKTRDRELLLDSVRAALLSSSSAAAYQIDGNNAQLWLLVYSMPGVSRALAKLLRSSGLKIIGLESTPLKDSSSLVKVRVRSKRKNEIEKNILSFLTVAQDLYQNLKAPTVTIERTPMTIEFSYTRLSLDLIFAVSDFLFKQRANITSSSFPPMLERKGRCRLKIEIPKQNADEFRRRLAAESKRFKRISDFVLY
ncbi:MAG: hypothetical protein PHH60_00235 [Candidatus Margulisbacteria bacterium]|nr:hypothetical protein [Candidatus Margulisiibacteriota bacterium]